MNMREAIRSRIIGDAPTVALLDTYAGGAAVFSPKKPEDHTYKAAPTVLIRKPTQLDDISPFGGQRSDVIISVVLYALLGENDTDDTAVESAALAIRELFRGKSFVGADGITYQALVSGPIAAPVENPQMTGELLQLRLNCGG
jgi:hypothetical protein